MLTDESRRDYRFAEALKVDKQRAGLPSSKACALFTTLKEEGYKLGRKNGNRGVEKGRRCRSFVVVGEGKKQELGSCVHMTLSE